MRWPYLMSTASAETAAPTAATAEATEKPFKVPSLTADPPTKIVTVTLPELSMPVTGKGKGSDAPQSELQDAQKRIENLEGQIKILTLRATSAVERATEYETALKRLTVASKAAQESTEATPVAEHAFPPTPKTPTAPANQQDTTTSRFARLLSTRYVAAGSAPPRSPAADQTPPASAGSDAALRDALTQEQTLRKAAEKAAEDAAAKTNSELEELTAQLFEQANEMVATERKARARLESRVEMLEKRDSDKARRLGLLEMRIQRVERVRSLLDKQNTTS